MAAVNSSLQRARAQVHKLDPEHRAEPLDDARAKELLADYVAAFEHYDVAADRRAAGRGRGLGDAALPRLVPRRRGDRRGDPPQLPRPGRRRPGHGADAANGQPAFGLYMRQPGRQPRGLPAAGAHPGADRVATSACSSTSACSRGSGCRRCCQRSDRMIRGRALGSLGVTATAHLLALPQYAGRAGHRGRARPAQLPAERRVHGRHLDADDYQARLDTLFAAQRMGQLVPVVEGLPPLQTYADPAIVAATSAGRRARCRVAQRDRGRPGRGRGGGGPGDADRHPAGGLCSRPSVVVAASAGAGRVEPLAGHRRRRTPRAAPACRAVRAGRGDRRGGRLRRGADPAARAADPATPPRAPPTPPLPATRVRTPRPAGLDPPHAVRPTHAPSRRPHPRGRRPRRGAGHARAPTPRPSATRTQRTPPTPTAILVRNPLYDQRIASSTCGQPPRPLPTSAGGATSAT